MNTNVKRTNPFSCLVTAVCACVSAFTGKPRHQIEAKPNVVMKVRDFKDRRASLTEKKKLRVESVDWRWHNQRQIRKNRRRAHAAGVRHAFP